MRHEEVIAEALHALLDARDFLGYQLCHARDGMDEEQLEEIAAHYLVETADPYEVLVEKALVLLPLLEPHHANAEVLSTLLRCTIEVAFRLEQEVAARRALLPTERTAP